MRDCNNCKHLVMYDYKNKSYSCEKWQCEFESKEQEPKTGHWIESDALLVIGNSETDNFMSIPAKECSVCHKPHIRAYAMNYCPNCGAKMAESEDT